ncbi:hypothetical protein FQV27_00520 [Paracoccus aurantiacus]|uniref:Uncharacterized protein n=1 Tax=Paracoccus aurantiacus TaxID=2599412 RepID=A0A5C6S7R2_9RHOB|nr:hypothetical protein [Paracoccus aurantiacus]TXB70398.1 hypothetical protein FQV27_00520 [Paracoccus aurantiacus]
MNPLLWSADDWGTAASVLGAIAAVGAVSIAHRGLSTWRKQENFKIDIELARNIIRSKHALRRKIAIANNMRHDFSIDEVFFEQFSSTLNAISLEKIDLLALAAEARVLWGLKQRRVFDLLERVSENVEESSTNMIKMMDMERKLANTMRKMPEQNSIPEAAKMELAEAHQEIAEARQEFAEVWEKVGGLLDEAGSIYENLSLIIDDILAARLGR